MPFDRLVLRPPVEPMETRQVQRIPEGAEWTYEPKWDGFRCIAFRDGDDVELQSKSGETLTRYFPEVVELVKSAPAQRFVIDGELLIAGETASDFDALLQRIHPAVSRVRRLAQETPASYVLFDLLVDGGSPLYEQPLRGRRKCLEAFVAQNFDGSEMLRLSPATSDVSLAQRWLDGSLARLDGVIAKRDVPYAFGSRDAVVKIKRSYTADCVIGGFRTSADGTIASLLLGLYDDAGLLNHVGFVGSMSAAERKRAADLLKPIVEPPGFTGAAPGGPSRWRRGDSVQWFPVRPQIVVEVAFDHVTGHRFRHATRLLRWRPDKPPRQCTMEQMLRPGRQARPSTGSG
ncbi:MAG: ATP-dependent DNA ligase [Candidatus Eremiobacteraeota bacterium]|nr:ATP-dependent DNA ligase [Candidatus Eremiobacteraeota bacterium]